MRDFEVIGEVAKRVPDDFRQARRELPCRGLAALRDVLIHQYEGASLSQVWQIIESELSGQLRVRDAE